MEDGQPNNSPNKFEVIQMFRIDARMRVDLEGVVIVSGIFEKAIKWIEHFV